MTGRKCDSSGRARLVCEKPIRPAGKTRPHPAAIRRQLFVADQPIRPEIGNLDFELVLSGPDLARDLHAKRRLPERPEILSVELHLRDVLYQPEVEIERL